MELSQMQQERLIKIDKLWQAIYGESNCYEAVPPVTPLTIKLTELDTSVNALNRGFYVQSLGRTVTPDELYDNIMARMDDKVREITSSTAVSDLNDERIEHLRFAIMSQLGEIVRNELALLIGHGHLTAQLRMDTNFY